MHRQQVSVQHGGAATADRQLQSRGVLRNAAHVFGERFAKRLLGRGLLAGAPPAAPRLAEGVLHALVPEEAGGASLRWAGDPLALSAAEAGWFACLAEGASLPEAAAPFIARLWRLGLVEG
jgi:hypothetical protein